MLLLTPKIWCAIKQQKDFYVNLLKQEKFMASLVIESNNPQNLKLLAKLAKQLGDKAKIVVEELKEKDLQKLTQEEKHLISAFKQGDLLKVGKLKTVDAKAFLNDLR